MMSGKCFGGPYDGQMMTYDRRERIVTYDPKPHSVLDFEPSSDPTLREEVVTLNRGIYRFTDGHGWVWNE